jgi:hypothetical protein
MGVLFMSMMGMYYMYYNNGSNMELCRSVPVKV